jgi:glycosyltransferase involved in cell wall biosynthesis
MTGTAGASPVRPLVSVIVPAWNAQEFIGRTLKSAAAQTYRNLEIIIVDDGSTDSTAECAEEFCRRDGRARLIRKNNGGVASARNRAIAEAKGEWIAPLDADDLWHPTKIEKEINEALSARQSPGFVYSWRRIIDPKGRILFTGPRSCVDGHIFYRLAYINVVGCGSAMLLRRDAAIEAGGYDESLRAEKAQGCEDLLLQLRIALNHPVLCVREHLVGWTSHDHNMSSDFAQMARSNMLVFRRLSNEGFEVPGRVVRWALSRDAFELAQQAASEGRYFSMSAHLAQSMVRDPLVCGLVISHRGIRLMRRLIGTARPKSRKLMFEEVDPRSDLPLDEHDETVFAALLRHLDESRLSQLERDQASMPRPSTAFRTSKGAAWNA